MAKDLRIVRRAFNAGEVSPQFAYRNDTEKHAFACSKLENFYVSPIGAISRRAGTKFLRRLGGSGDDVRLVPFEYSRDSAYVLAFKPAASASETFSCTSKPMSLPAVYSVCFTLPSPLPSVDLDFFEQNGIAVHFDKTGKLRINSDGAQTVRAGDKFVIIRKSGAYNAYRNGTCFARELSAAESGDGSFTVHSAVRGDMWGLKIVGFDMSEANAYYTIADFQNGTNDAMCRVFAGGNTRVVRYSNHANYGGEFDDNTVQPILSDALSALKQGKANLYADKYSLGYLVPDAFKPSSLSFSDGRTRVNTGIVWSGGLGNIKTLFEKTHAWDDTGAADDAAKIARGNALVAAWTAVFAALGLSAELAAHKEAIQAEHEIWDSNGAVADGKADLYASYAGNLCEFAKNFGLNYQCDRGEFHAAFPETNGWEMSFFGNLAPLAYDFIRVEHAIPQNAELLFNPTGASIGGREENAVGEITDNINVYGVAADGTTLVPLDGSPRSADIAYLLFAVPVAYPRGASVYDARIASALYANLALDNSLVWRSSRVLLMSAYDVNGVAVCENVDTQIPSDALWEFQYKQAGGWIFLAHSSFAPKKLSFDGSGFEVSQAVAFEPSLDTESGVVVSCGAAESENADGIILAGDVAAISANTAFFTPDMVGTQLKLEYSDKAAHTYKWPYRKANNKIADGAYIGASTVWIPPTGTVVVKPEGGVWEGVLVLEESTDNGESWSEIGRSSAIQGSENTQFEREIYNVRSLVRARLIEQSNVADTSSTKVEAAVEGCFFNIYTNSSCCAWVEIQSVSSDGKSATAKFINPARAYFQTDKVFKSAWGDASGYPRAVEIHEERLTLAGTRAKPSTVWLSQTNNWDNFRSVSNLDTDPLAYTLTNDDGEPIAWVVSKSDLMIGLGSSEWSLGSRDASQSLTASIVKASNQSQDGVEYTMPAKAANMVIYVRRGDRELGSISYDFASDAYNSVSLTTICPEILGVGVKTLFNQLSPRNYIWALRNDGVCGVFTYDRENNVSAWARFTFGDGAVGACALSTGKFRSVFLAVRRGGHLCLERLDPNEADGDNWLDCVPILTNTEVPDGLSTGVRYTSRMETTPIFAEGHIKVHCAEFIMLDSYGGQYRLKGFNDAGEPLDDERDWRNLAMRSGDILGRPAPQSYRFTGNCQSGYLEECSIEVKTDEAAPFTLCAIAVKAGGV